MILELGVNNFQSEINEHDVVVLFYANWCGHCHNMMPEFEKFANDEYDEVKIARIDCGLKENQGICQANNIGGYPTMKFFDHDGDVIDFSPYRRTAEAMKEKLEEILNK